MFVCMYVCMYACQYVCMYVFVCVCIYIYLYIHTHIYAYDHKLHLSHMQRLRIYTHKGAAKTRAYSTMLGMACLCAMRTCTDRKTDSTHGCGQTDTDRQPPSQLLGMASPEQSRNISHVPPHPAPYCDPLQAQPLMFCNRMLQSLLPYPAKHSHPPRTHLPCPAIPKQTQKLP